MSEFTSTVLITDSLEFNDAEAPLLMESKQLIHTKKGCVLYSCSVQAGFPSPADGYVEAVLDLNEHLIRHPSATFFARAQGESMLNLGIFDGDLLIVDRSLEPRHGDVVIAVLDGQLTCKMLDTHRRRLLSGNDRFPPIPIRDTADFSIEGVVIHSIQHHRVY